MRILLISGHGNGDSGAVGNGYKEADLTRELVNLIAPKLREYATVDIYNPTRNAYQDVKNGAFYISNYDYALEIHFNAHSNASAHGTECYVTTMEKGIKVEQSIMTNLRRYFTLRDNDAIKDGVKRSNFAVIKTLKDKGISGALLEVCFISNKTDMIVYNANKDSIAEDIVGGIVNGFGLKNKLKKIKKGATVSVSKNAVIGGLSTNRGDKASNYLTSKTWIIDKVEIHNGVSEALLHGANTWIATKYLTVI